MVDHLLGSITSKKLEWHKQRVEKLVCHSNRKCQAEIDFWHKHHDDVYLNKHYYKQSDILSYVAVCHFYDFYVPNQLVVEKDKAACQSLTLLFATHQLLWLLKQ